MFTDSLMGALKDMWPMLTIFSVIIITIRIAYLRNNEDEKFVFYKEFFGLLFIIYLILLFEMVTNTDKASGGINLVPFTEIFRYKIGSSMFYYNIIGNIIVLIPFGYFISAYVKGKKVGQILIITLISSLTIELVQLGIGRAFDVDDIILNVVGGIIGFLLYISLTAIKKHLPKFFRKDFFYNIIALVILAVITFYIASALGLGLGFINE